MLFLTELCSVLGLPQPEPAGPDNEYDDYVFERAVAWREAGEKVAHGRIDLYRRGHFILEAKQSRQPGGPKAWGDGDDLFGAPEPKTRGRRSIGRNWDVLMMNARLGYLDTSDGGRTFTTRRVA